MLQSVPQRGAAKPRLLGTFSCWTYVTIQIVGPNTLFIAETDNALMQTDDSGTIDALQLTQAGAPGGLYQFWWMGDMWGAGSVAFKPLIIVPGATTGSTGAQIGAYGIQPTEGLVAQ